MIKMQRKAERYIYFFFLIAMPALLCGCSHLHEGAFKEANGLFMQGNYPASLNKYAQILEKYPSQGDRVLFEMGLIHAFPGNEQQDYQKALASFQKLIREYPESRHKQDSEILMALVGNIATKDKEIRLQQELVSTLKREIGSKGIEIGALRSINRSLEQELKIKGDELETLQKKIASLTQTIYAIQNGPADKILVEKKERRLTLLAGDKVLKTYRIALGGNPVGHKESQGDQKTPEGSYIISGRNKNSLYHLSLRISYPNENDIRRARELGVSPGGDIMIHGIKKGLSWVGDRHTTIDWTEGCIAVTNEEIEEIANLVPNGTKVEIRP